MNRKAFLKRIGLSLLASCATIACSLKPPLVGVWKVVKEDGSEPNISYEFFDDGSLITSTPFFTNSSTYKVLDGDRMRWTSDKTNSSEIIFYRIEGDYLYLRGVNSDREVKHKKSKK